MAESVGKIECQKKGCPEIAELCKDKRGKFYLKCPVHGTDKLGTNAAQAEIKKIIEAGNATEDIGGVILGTEPEKAAKPEPVTEPEKKPVPEKENGGGLTFFIISFFIGAGAWLWKKSKQV